ncbi:hypothetical protein D9M72_453220 [compost metagenome]
MASHRASDVSHFTRSTPAVRAPWFIATRRTADALADHERVRDLCKAFTLRQSPSCVAFAIRICITRTFRSTRRQSMSPHLPGTPEGADSSLRINASMLPSYLEDLPQHRETTCPLRDRLSPKGRKIKQASSVSRLATRRPVGSLPAFAWDDVSTPIRAVTARHSLFPTSHTRTANSVPYGSPA